VEEFEEVHGRECERHFLYMKNIIPGMENSKGLIITFPQGRGRKEFRSWVHTAHQNCGDRSTESAALEVNNVKIVALCPGSVDTGCSNGCFW